MVLSPYGAPELVVLAALRPDSHQMGRIHEDSIGTLQLEDSCQERVQRPHVRWQQPLLKAHRLVIPQW
jgi:hypothetical protein